MLRKLKGAGHAQRLPDADQNLKAYCRGISSSRGDNPKQSIESPALLPIPQWC